MNSFGFEQNRIADVAEQWNTQVVREGLDPAGHGERPAGAREPLNFVGNHPQNPDVKIGTVAANRQTLPKYAGTVVLVQNGDKFYPAVVTMQRGAVGFTRVPVAVQEPASPELREGVAEKLKELRAQQDYRTGNAIYDRPGSATDVAGHGGAGLLAVRDKLAGKSSVFTAHSSHALANQTGGFGVGIAAKGLYARNHKGREIVMAPPVYEPATDGMMFAYSPVLDRAVDRAVAEELSPEAVAVASGAAAVASLLEKPVDVIISNLTGVLSARR